MNQKFIIIIFSDDKKGLLNQIIAIFNKRNFDIESFILSRTHVKNLLILTFEVLLPGIELQTTLKKIEKIIEVYKVTSFSGEAAKLKKISFFRISNDILNNSTISIIQEYKAQITQFAEDTMILEKSGSHEEILELYNILKGQYLISFLESSLVHEKALLYFPSL